MKLPQDETLKAALIVRDDGSLYMVDEHGKQVEIDQAINRDYVENRDSPLSRIDVLMLLHTICHNAEFRQEMCQLMHKNYPELTKKRQH